MVQDGDADEVTGLTESGGEHTIFWTGFRMPGGMIVGANDRGAIQEDRGFEDFARMDDAERERANGHDIDADDGVFGVQTGDEELFTIETVKERTEYGGRPRGIADEHRWVRASVARHELECVARNEQRIRHVRTVDDRAGGILRNVSRGHHGTSLLLD